MKVTIRLSTEISYSITIPNNSTVEDLRNSAKVACPSFTKLPPDFKLIFNGEKLTPYYKSLLFFNINSDIDNTVILMSNGSDTPINELSPISTPINLSNSTTTSTSTTTVPLPKKKTKKNKCNFSKCNSTPLRLVGDCGHCNGKFCAKHRLLEDHYCHGLQYCKDNAHERNAMKLQSESTIVSKV